MRELKGMELAARARIVFINGHWVVPSQTSPTTSYKVNLEPVATCECDDWQLRKQDCKHVIAARIVMARDGSEPAPEIDTTTVPKRPTYQQADWSVYKMAQRQEKPRFLELLADLVSGVEEPARQGCGRKPVPIKDRLFSVCYKVWSTLSGMRFDGDLQQAVTDGYISRTLHPNKVLCFMEDSDLTPYLKAMIVRSSLPLAAIETEFAVDSSGFTTSKFVPWVTHKYGKEVISKKHSWIKVHLAAGVHTHIITAAAIYDRDTADCPVMPELVKQTAENFTVDEFSADKAYLSLDNVNEVFNAGGVPFIAPKSNTTGGIGGKFEEMVHYYLYKREEFLKHYHKRSNVESVFSAIGRKFSGHVRSRTDTAGMNEVLCKLICNNIWCVILSQAELGIEAEFWQDEPEEEQGDGPAILKFARPG